MNASCRSFVFCVPWVAPRNVLEVSCVTGIRLSNMMCSTIKRISAEFYFVTYFAVRSSSSQGEVQSSTCWYFVVRSNTL